MRVMVSFEYEKKYKKVSQGWLGFPPATVTMPKMAAPTHMMTSSNLAGRDTRWSCFCGKVQSMGIGNNTIKQDHDSRPPICITYFS